LDVLVWLARVTPDTASGLLVGCGFHDGKSDTLEVTIIEAVDVARATVTLAGSATPVSLRRFRDGEFIDTRPGAPLATAVAASRTPSELRDEAEHLAVRRAGFDPGKLPSGDARRAVLVMVELDAVGKTPDEVQRAAFYGAVRPGGDAGTARLAARLFTNALRRFEVSGSNPEDLHWRLATLLRQAGEWQAAVQAAGVLYSRPGLREKTRLYLASTMAGALLDLAGARPTPVLLSEAERALRIAWALNKGDEALRSMWRTLDQLQGNDGGKR
jgi:hypothetical protein